MNIKLNLKCFKEKTLYKLQLRRPIIQVHDIAKRFSITQIIYIEKLKFIYKF